ncbi:caspase family protein [Streptosporangium sp. NPDC051023]|uniref:caspase, EACC1-associated type n=1 Tax=Streptosporangium sp. NPDC051023 TaxID=3155410 RepID=UPI00344B0F0F
MALEQTRLMLASPGTHVLLAGSGSYVTGSRLLEVPSVRTTVTDLNLALIQRAGLDPAHLTTLLDPPGPQEFGAALVEAAEQATDVLVLYYVGHGLVSARNELHLATRATVDLTRGIAAHQALPYSAVMEVLAGCRASLILVVLDCCFSGRARSVGRPGLEEVFDSVRQGMYLLTSTNRDESAWAPAGERHTAFSGALIRLLTSGDPTGPPLLTLDDAYRSMSRQLTERGFPRPRRQAADLGDRQPLVPNIAHRSAGTELTGEPGGEFSPYRGLASFGPEDSRYFFGRSDLTRTLVDRVAEQLSRPGVLVVAGPSGSGKSSLLSAGLIPALERPSGKAAFALITPGGDPVGALAKRFAALDGSHAADLRRRLEEDPGHLRAVLSRAPGRPVLIVDQFEEAFTACSDEEQRRIFIQALDATCADPVEEASAVVVLGVRADFFGHCAAHPELLAPLEHPMIVGPMTTADLREVIELPARLAGLTLQDGLVDLILEDLGASAKEAGNGRLLPLLSHSLLATWQHREGLTLTLAGYRATGGITRSLAQTADSTLEHLDLPERQTARHLLSRLVRLGEGMEDTRRQVALAELLPSSQSPDHLQVRRVLEEFVHSRLLSVDEGHVEITHEALIRAWPQLRTWIEADRASLLVRQQLSDDAAEWLRHGKDPAFLYTDTRLTLALESVQDGRGAEPSPAERTFLDEGGRRQRRRARTVYQVIAALTVLLLFAVLATVTAVVEAGNATRQKIIADRERDIALSRHFADVSGETADPSFKAQLSLAAYRFADTPEARAALLSTLNAPTAISLAAHTTGVDTLAFRTDRPVMMSQSQEGTFRVWDMTDPRHPAGRAVLGGSAKPIWRFAFSPTSPIMATVTSNLVIQLWDFHDLAHPVPGGIIDGGDRYISGLAISRDGRTMAYATTGTKLNLVDITDFRHPRTLSSLKSAGFVISELAFSPDGKVLAVPSNSGLELWDTRNPAHPKRWSVLKTSLTLLPVMHYSEDGRSIIGCFIDGDIQFFDVSRPAHPTSRTVRKIGVLTYGSAVSADGRMAATASIDGMVRLWDLADASRPKPLASFRADTDFLRSVAFAPDGRTVLVGSNDGTIRSWSMDEIIQPPPTARLSEHPADLVRTAIAPTRKLAATMDADGTLRIWDISRRGAPALLAKKKSGAFYDLVRFGFTAGERVLFMVTARGEMRTWSLTNPSDPEERPLFKGNEVSQDDTFGMSSDGRLVAAAEIFVVDVYDVGGSGAAVSRGRVRTDNGFPYSVVEFTPDSRLVAGGLGGTRSTYEQPMKVLLWDLSRPQASSETGAVDVNGQIVSIAFTPDGRTMAVASLDKTVSLFDIRSPAHPVFLSRVKADVRSVDGLAFSPDGRLLGIAAGSLLHLWNAGDPRIPREIDTLAGHTGPIHDVAFGADSGSVITSAADGTVRSWILDHTRAISRICARTGGLTPEQWKRWIPDAPYREQCP